MELEEVQVSPQTAEQYLSLKPVYQRNPRKYQIAKYANEMRRGAWMPIGDGSIITIAETEQGEFLINGQHRLLAIIESDTVQCFKIARYKITDEQARRLYSLFDGQANRTIMDVIRTLKDENMHGYASRTFRKLIESVKVIIGGFSRSTLSIPNDLAIDTAYEWLDEFGELESIFRDTDLYKPFYTATSIACGLYILKFQPQKAKMFLSDVAHGNVENAQHPTRRLREYILSTPQRGGEEPRNLRMFAFSRCWNAYWNTQLVKRLSLPDRVILHGTPLE